MREKIGTVTISQGGLHKIIKINNDHSSIYIRTWYFINHNLRELSFGRFLNTYRDLEMLHQLNVE